MTSSEKAEPQFNSNPTGFGSHKLLLSLATGPLLLGLVGAKVLTEGIRDLGLLSEEILRGDRLPILNFPAPPPSDPGDTNSI